MLELPDVPVEISEDNPREGHVFRRLCDIDHTLPLDTRLVEVIVPIDPNAFHTTVKAIGTAKKLLDTYRGGLHGHMDLEAFLRSQPAGNTKTYCMGLASYPTDPATYRPQIAEVRLQKIPTFIRRHSGIHHYGVPAMAA